MQYSTVIKLKLNLLCEFEEQVKSNHCYIIVFKTGKVLQALNDKNFWNFRLDKISPVSDTMLCFGGKRDWGKVAWDQAPLWEKNGKKRSKTA